MIGNFWYNTKNTFLLRDYNLGLKCADQCVLEMIECYEECDAEDFDCRQRCGRDQVNCSNGKTSYDSICMDDI